MERLRKEQISGILILVVFLALVPSHLSFAGAGETKIAAVPLNIQGFRTGMTMNEAKKLLRKKNVKQYETDFTDLYVYRPSPYREIRLLFTCSGKGYLLGRVELTIAFTKEETERALAKFKKKLIAKYGAPAIREAEQDRLEFCWGSCKQDTGGMRLTARTKTPQGDKRALVLTLSDDALILACSERRSKKINTWLYQWIGAVQKFKLAMSFRDAAKLYRQHYHDSPVPGEEKDESSKQHEVTNIVVKERDFFTGLEYDSLAFEGAGPGEIILKFTGDRAGKGSSLNERLYYASFSTTKFRTIMPDAELQKRLRMFTGAYGSPSNKSVQEGRILALWEDGAVRRKVEIDNSGFIMIEQSDFSLRDAYRDAVIRIGEKNKGWKFDGDLF